MSDKKNDSDNKPDIEIVRRLSFIRYMHTQGAYYANQSEPVSSISILLFHDSVEFFLQLTCRFTNINCKDCYFMDYFSRIQTKTKVNLKKREEMRLLNDLRNDLKHEGRLISRLHIDEVRSNVLEFFKENTSLVFGMDFDSLSLIEFVECSVAKELLVKAQEDMKNLKSTEAANKISIAFDYLINDYLNETFGYDNNPTKHFKKEEGRAKYFGLNYSDYLRFRKLVSTPFRVNGMGLGIPANTREYTKEENQFCLNFTVGTAMKIQKYLHSDVYD